MPRDINTLLRKDALMKVDKRSEKYVQPSRRRRRGDGDDAGLAHERRGGGGGGGGGRACPSYRTALLPSRRRGEEEGEGRGVWRNSPDAICINEPPDNGARSMNYVPRDSNPNETRIIAFDSSLAPLSARRAPRSVGRHCSSASVAASLCVVPRGKRSSFGESEIASFSFRFSVRLGVERWACRAERLGLLMEFLSRRLVGLSSFSVVGG